MRIAKRADDSQAKHGGFQNGANVGSNTDTSLARESGQNSAYYDDQAWLPQQQFLLFRTGRLRQLNLTTFLQNRITNLHPTARPLTRTRTLYLARYSALGNSSYR